MATSPDEALLVLRAQFGDREALEALLRIIRPSLARYVAGIVGADEAEDLIQDVLFLIYRKLGGLQNAGVFRPWAFRVASRAAFKHLKKRTPASRAVLTLHFKEEMTLAEVAAVLEIPIGTVRSRLAYGLATLRKQLSGRRNDDVPTTRTHR